MGSVIYQVRAYGCVFQRVLAHFHRFPPFRISCSALVLYWNRSGGRLRRQRFLHCSRQITLRTVYIWNLPDFGVLSS